MGRPRNIATRFADQVTVRMPEGLRDELRKKAAESGRSANTEIVHRLQQSLEEDESPGIAAIREHFDRRIDELIAIILAKK
nr:Arc family DNA-binding protein [Pseudomonas sp.]